jgi:hypothetical protein
MKDIKDFDVNQFLQDGSMTETAVATGDTHLIKQSVLTVTSKPTAPAPSSGQAVKPRQTASAMSREQSAPSGRTASAQSTEPTQSTQPTEPPQRIEPTIQLHRTSSRQRRASLDEYRETFLPAPKIVDRQPVFVSHEVRDRIDSVVRRLGERKMSVSGFLENLARHHLDLYTDDLEQWRRL